MLCGCLPNVRSEGRGQCLGQTPGPAVSPRGSLSASPGYSVTETEHRPLRGLHTSGLGPPPLAGARRPRPGVRSSPSPSLTSRRRRSVAGRPQDPVPGARGTDQREPVRGAASGEVSGGGKRTGRRHCAGDQPGSNVGGRGARGPVSVTSSCISGAWVPETGRPGAPRLPFSPDAPRVCHGHGLLWGPLQATQNHEHVGGWQVPFYSHTVPVPTCHLRGSEEPIPPQPRRPRAGPLLTCLRWARAFPR